MASPTSRPILVSKSVFRPFGFARGHIFGMCLLGEALHPTVNVRPRPHLSNTVFFFSRRTPAREDLGAPHPAHQLTAADEGDDVGQVHGT
jgi:hypothetical protein